MLDFLAAGTGAAAGPAGFLGGIGGFVPIIGMIAIFYFLLIRPQMRQQNHARRRKHDRKDEVPSHVVPSSRSELDRVL